MWPHSLLFSSDEEASHNLSRALRDLEFEVETCPEIFSAVEKITRRSFDVVISDWNEGLEAVFLLKTVRELKANQTAFTIAIAGTEAAVAAREAGADLVLSRPLVPDQVKYALLNCDSFLVQMKSWLPRAAQAPVANTSPDRNPNLEKPTPVAGPRRTVPESSLAPVAPTDSRLPAWPSPPPIRRTEPVAPPMVAAEPIFDDDLLYRSRVQTLFRNPEPSFSSSTTLPKKKSRNRVLPGMAIAVAFLSLGYVFSEPLRGQGTTASVAKMCGRMLERTEAWLHRPDDAARPAPGVLLASNQGMQFARSGQGVTRINVGSAGGPVQAEPAANVDELPQPVPVEPEPPVQQSSASTSAIRIPESLKTSPLQTASLRTVAARIAPSILAALEPVSLSEDLSRRLLLQKVLPNYPEQAVKARLQGPVVLQAWIARDGTIQDLKLVRGSFLLGQAAYRAVKQWRYQPYLVNGRAVEAETFVTVDFRLP
jgi:TonB family protein